MSLPAPPNRRSNAALAEQRVVAGLAEELVGARTAGQRVVAGAAEEVARRGSAPLASLSVIDVVAALAEDLESARCWRRWACRP